MCRMVAYLGGPVATLSSVVLEPEHSLLIQSYAPKEMMSGVVNTDGFGVGWYVPWSGEEVRLEFLYFGSMTSVIRIQKPPLA